VYAYSPDGSSSEPIEIKIENKPYTEAIEVNIEIVSEVDSDERTETYNKKYLNVNI
jgi:hypothetical protein